MRKNKQIRLINQLKNKQVLGKKELFKRYLFNKFFLLFLTSKLSVGVNGITLTLIGTSTIQQLLVVNILLFLSFGCL